MGEKLDRCRMLCREAKYIGNELQWGQRDNRDGDIRATSPLLDNQRATIPGLFFQGDYEYKKFGPRFAFAIMLRDQREVRRVFMVEVYPNHIASHTSPNGEKVFGPHAHLGDERWGEDEWIVKQFRRVANVENVEWWIKRFKRHASILDDRFTLTAPFADDLFGAIP